MSQKAGMHAARQHNENLSEKNGMRFHQDAGEKRMIGQ